jgi:protein involved in polysaccharide export with SLBB domain
MNSILMALAITGLQALQPSAATVAGPGDQPAPTPVIDQLDPDEYILGPGDVLWLTAVGGLPTGFYPVSGTSILYLTVAPDGAVVIPMVGAVPVSGLTLAEGTWSAARAVSDRFRGVDAEAGLAGVRSCRVPLTGEVGSPGIIDAQGSDRLSDILTDAGGILPGGSVRSVLVIHSTGDTTVVDYSSYLRSGDLGCNPMLSPGDRVRVLPASEFVEIEGAVVARGMFPLGRDPEGAWLEGSRVLLEYIEGETAGEAVLRAGGFAPWALRDSVFIEHVSDGEVVVPESAPGILDTPLSPGDRVVCPGSPGTIAVTGYVYQPGTYTYVAGSDAFYYIAQAGGATFEGNAGGTRIILPGGHEADADDLSSVPSGAVIEVPRRGLVWWQDHLTILVGLASIVIAWKSIF